MEKSNKPPIPASDPTDYSMECSNKLLLSVGGNLHISAERFYLLWEKVEHMIGHVNAISPYYKSKSWGFVSEHPFVNAAAEVLTNLPPMEVLYQTQEIEKQLGRVSKSRNGIYSDRPMDIDIIAYNDLIIKNEELEIPHPRMTLRRFVLQPLCDITPDWKHPILHLSVKELLENCKDDIILTRL